MTEKTNVYIIVYGNLNDGFKFVGPFQTFDEADQNIDPDRSQFGVWVAIMESVL